MEAFFVVVLAVVVLGMAGLALFGVRRVNALAHGDRDGAVR